MKTVGASSSDTKKVWQSFAPGKGQLVFFDNLSEYRIEYQDIQRSPDVSSCICGVVEHNQRPLIYIARTDSLTGQQPIEIDQVCHLLACRGEEAFLAVVSAGTLILYPCLLSKGSAIYHTFKFESAPSLIRGLSEGIIPQELLGADKQIKEINLRKQMLAAFICAAQSLRKVKGLTQHNDPQDDHDRLSIILALLGRVLFMCFLCDRDLAPPEAGSKRTNPYDKFSLFNDAASAAWIFHWQDVTFNGDFLPLFPNKSGDLPTTGDYVDFFKKYSVLSQIQVFTNGEDENRLSLIRLLNFRHVPIGLLSEVYETFAHKFFEGTARATSVHYTPRHVAAVMVEQAFQGIPKAERGDVLILDPSAGAGVFLVFSLRRIVQEKAAQGKIITAALIREVLYKQIRGMDISLHALHLSTLALYLAAIDLDPHPSPVTKHHFDVPLLGTVVRWVHDSSGLGALGDKGACEVLNGPFDLVIGNPPWTKLDEPFRQKGMRKATFETASRVRPTIHEDLAALGGTSDELSPGYNPAFPFLWRSLEWAKDNGIIALVLPAEQILFREHGSRNILFRNLTVTGIVNGADLHKSSFWDGMEEPFCLFFARNRIPGAEASFVYLNVFVEALTAQQHRLRFDSSQSKELALNWLEEVPYLLKTFFRGSELDLAVLEKMQSSRTLLFKDFCENKGVSLHNGYTVKGLAKDVDLEKQAKKRQKQADKYGLLRSLKGLHLVAGKHLGMESPLLTDPMLPEFNLNNRIDHIDAPRNPKIYKPPLVLIPQAAKQELLFYVGTRNVIFSQSHFSVSLSGIDEAEYIATYLAIIFQAELPRYYSLLTSARYGSNWNTVLLHEYESFPIVPWEKINIDQKAFCKKVLTLWQNGESISKEKLFSWACSVYSLNKYEQQVILDTLKTKDPGARKSAQNIPSLKMQGDFLDYVRRDVIELGRVYNQTFDIGFSPLRNDVSGWLFSDFFVEENKSKNFDLKRKVANICAAIADHEGCSQIIIADRPNKYIGFGLLSQQRYWTYSQARLFSQKIKAEIDRNRLEWGIK